MAGLKTNEILEVMPGMLDLAAAGNLQLSDAADIATNVMSMYGMELSEIGHLSDVLAKAAASSNTNVYELSEAIKNVGATANQAGVSVEETTGALMILANSGIKGGEAGTQLMNAFKALTAMTPKTAKALKAMDIAPESLLDSEGKIKDFNGILSQLASKGATLGELFQIFDIRGAKAMAVLKDAGDKQLSSFITSLENADGTAKSMAKTLMKGAPGAIKRFQSALEGVKLVMASTILPAFTSLITKVSQVFAYLQESAPWVLKFATYGLVLFAALGAIVVPLGIIASSLGTLLTLIGAISAPVLAVVAAVTAVGAAFVYWYKSAHPVIDVIKRMANLIGGVFAPLIPDLSGFFEGGAKSAGFFSAAMDKLGSVLQVMLSPLEAMLVLVRGLVEGFVSIVTLDFDKLKGIGGKLMSGLGDAGGSFVGGIKDLFGMGDSTETTARDASQEKTRATTNNNKVNANINLRAEKGTNVSAAEPDLDTGGNVAFAN
jgi:TP901 family phage tail tape measure protein